MHMRCNNGILQKAWLWQQKVLQKAQVVIMAAPLVLAAMVLGSTILQNAWNIYGTYKTTELKDQQLRYTRDYQGAFYNENTRFWNDYIKRHHLEKRQIMYPYRTGFNYDLSKMYSAERDLDINSFNRKSSIVNGLLGSGRSAAFLYGTK